MADLLTEEEIRSRIITQFGVKNFSADELPELESFLRVTIGINHVSDKIKETLKGVSNTDDLEAVILAVQIPTVVGNAATTAKPSMADIHMEQRLLEKTREKEMQATGEAYTAGQGYLETYKRYAMQYPEVLLGNDGIAKFLAIEGRLDARDTMISTKTVEEKDPTFARKMLIAANLTGVQEDIDYTYQALMIAYGKMPHTMPEQAAQNATQDLDKIQEVMKQLNVIRYQDLSEMVKEANQSLAGNRTTLS